MPLVTPEKKAKNRAKARARRERLKREGRFDEIWRKYFLKSNYGISLETYKAMLIAQGNACAICRKPQLNKSLAVDHNHNCCGEKRACDKCRRGLLCSNCNQALGKFQDSVTVLQNAVDYLSRFNANPA